MASWINARDKADALAQCSRFLQYFPYRYAFVIEFSSGEWGYTTGKTLAKGNTLARKGHKVFRVTLEDGK